MPEAYDYDPLTVKRVRRRARPAPPRTRRGHRADPGSGDGAAGRTRPRPPGASGGAHGAVVVGLAVILGIVGLQILDDSGRQRIGSATATTVAGTPTTGGTTTTPIRPNNEVRVKVYNGSGVQGVAQTLTDKLRAEGYNMQAPANRRQGTPGHRRPVRLRVRT